MAFQIIIMETKWPVSFQPRRYNWKKFLFFTDRVPSTLILKHKCYVLDLNTSIKNTFERKKNISRIFHGKRLSMRSNGLVFNVFYLYVHRHRKCLMLHAALSHASVFLI